MPLPLDGALRWPIIKLELSVTSSRSATHIPMNGLHVSHNDKAETTLALS